MSQTGVVAWSQTAASNGTADSNVNWAEGQAPSSVNDSARAEMASVAKYRDDTAGTLTTAGTSTAYTLTTNQVFSSLTVLNGQELSVKFNATNGASPTLNVDGLGAKAINVDTATAVGTGLIKANSVWSMVYDNSNSCFILKGVPASIQSGTVATASIAANAVTYAKLQTETASTLLGNPTGSGAVPSEITLAGNLFFNGTTIVGGAPRGYIDGLVLSAASTTSIGISAGVARDSTNTIDITLASAFTKTTSSWASGTAAGGLDTGVIATSTWYYVFGILRTDTGATDILYSTSYSSPTLPANYTKKRYIGAFKTDGSSHVVAFHQFGDLIRWDTPAVDFSGTATTTYQSVVLSVPPSATVIAFGNVNSANTFVTQIRPTFGLDTTPGISSNSLGKSGTDAGKAVGEWTCVCDTSGQVQIAASGSGTVVLTTEGYYDRRGKNA